MARLQKFNGTQTLPGVGSPQVIADTAVGAATVNLGKQIDHSLQDLGELAEIAVKHHVEKREEAERETREEAERETIEARANDLANRKNVFAGRNAAEGLQREVRQRLAEPQATSSGTPVPLADEMVEFMKATEAKISSGLPAAQKHSFDRGIELREDQLRTDIAAAENRQDEVYFLNGINESREMAVETVSRSPDRLDEAFDTYLDLVDTAALPRRIKEHHIQEGGRDLLEAWVQAHPLDLQVAELADLEARQSAGPDPDTASAKTSGSGNGVQSEFAARAGALPENSRTRMLANALKNKEDLALTEHARIAERIDTAHDQIDPSEIARASLLRPEARMQMLTRYQHVVDAHARKVSALQWIATEGKSTPRATHENDLANDAFGYLVEGKTDPGVLMRAIAFGKGVFPRNAANTLVRSLASETAVDVAQAFHTLSELGSEAVEDGPGRTETVHLRTLLAAKTFLTAEQGLSREAVAALFADANQAPVRKERQKDFDVLHSGQHTEKTMFSSFA